MKPQVDPAHYQRLSYDSKSRFISYWHQIDEVLSIRPRNMLEIGIGNGFVSSYLKSKGIHVTNLDIDERLKPEVAGSVLAIPFLEKSFQLLACFELLEHLPYKCFPAALKELNRVSEKHVLLSLPDVTTVYRFNIELPKLKPIKWLICHPRHRPANHCFEGQHYWEIGGKGFPLNKIKTDIICSGFNIIKTYRVFEFYYHRFFLLKKSEV
jgi:ubiquinone/menaquinone biosynthesis C-methylase UbiE